MTLHGDARLAEPLLEEEVRVSDAIVAAMADAGIEFVLGIPGGLTGIIWRSLHEHPTIRPVLVREESLGSYMAEAYGRLRGRPLVVMGQGEWMVGNAGQGYLESLLGSSPMIVLTEMSDGGPLRAPRSLPGWFRRLRRVGREEGARRCHQACDGEPAPRPGRSTRPTRSEACAHRRPGPRRGGVRQRIPRGQDRTRLGPPPLPGTWLSQRAAPSGRDRRRRVRARRAAQRRSGP